MTMLPLSFSNPSIGVLGGLTSSVWLAYLSCSLLIHDDDVKKSSNDDDDDDDDDNDNDDNNNNNTCITMIKTFKEEKGRC